MSDDTLGDYTAAARPLLRSFSADSGVQRFLVDALRQIRTHTNDVTVRESVEDVLYGRRSLYSVFEDEKFTEAAWAGIDGGVSMVMDLDDDEFDGLVATGQQMFESRLENQQGQAPQAGPCDARA